MTHDGEGDWIHKKMTTYVVDVLTGSGWEGARLEAGLVRKERHTQSESGLGCRCGLDREVDERVGGAIWCGGGGQGRVAKDMRWCLGKLGGTVERRRAIVEETILLK